MKNRQLISLIALTVVVSLSFLLGQVTAGTSDRTLQVKDSSGSRLYRKVTLAGQTFCLGPASWYAAQVGGSYREEWLADPNSWIDTGKGAVNNRPYTLAYSTSSGCNNNDGGLLTNGAWEIYVPTGEYGGFVTIRSADEWYHNQQEAGVRSYPNSWTVSGTL